MQRKNISKTQQNGNILQKQTEFTHLTTPRAFERLAPGADGSIYGLSPERLLSTFQRPSTKTKIKGLYLAGGGTHPGPGCPWQLYQASMRQK